MQMQSNIKSNTWSITHIYLVEDKLMLSIQSDQCFNDVFIPGVSVYFTCGYIFKTFTRFFFFSCFHLAKSYYIFPTAHTKIALRIMVNCYSQV